MKDEIGNVYGRLTVIARAGSAGSKAAWLYRCSCGVEKIASGDSLRQGNIKSCGCYRREFSTTKNTTHGMTRTPTYRSWQEMRVRCADPTSISYPNYGGRGIKVCKRWARFENFLADMGVRPEGLSLDRRNTAKNYIPSNCKWSSRTEQNRNKRSNVVVSYRGKRRCLSEWCELLSLPYPRVYYRIVINKWATARAFETPTLRPTKRNPS